MTDTNDSNIVTIREAVRRLRDLPGDLKAENEPVFTTEQIRYLEKRFCEIRAILDEIVPDDEVLHFDFFIHERLAAQHQIGHIWSVEDVLSIRPDLTDAQAWGVLQQVRRMLDSDFGINWLTLEYAAEDLYPEPVSDEKETPHGN